MQFYLTYLFERFSSTSICRSNNKNDQTKTNVLEKIWEESNIFSMHCKILSKRLVLTPPSIDIFGLC